MTEKPQPHRCEACVREGGYVGILVWPGYEPPPCKYHPKERLTPVGRPT